LLRLLRFPMKTAMTAMSDFMKNQAAHRPSPHSSRNPRLLQAQHTHPRNPHVRNTPDHAIIPP
jgi:hypothetical protein